MSVSRFPGVLVGYAAVLALVACAEQRQRSEARAFLAVYESLDHRQPAAVREEKLKALKQLTLVDLDVKRARDDCVSAHRALLVSEREHERAASKLDQVVSKNHDGSPLPPELTEPIRVGIEQADRSLQEARTRFSRCETAARSLSLRFGNR
jgi:hypothetical protein